MTIYRKIYEENHGPIPIDEDGRSYEIHHIDGSRSNNSIENLMCVTIQEHFDIHYLQGDYNACVLILGRMNLTVAEISEKARDIACAQLKEGSHNFSKPDFQKRNAIRRVEEGTHHWLGERNPSHKRVQEGTHNFQKLKKKICEHCGKEAYIGNYVMYHGKYCYQYTSIKSPGLIRMLEKSGKHTANTIWITDGNTNKRIGKESIIPINWKRGKTGTTLRKVKCPHCDKEGGISQMKQWHFDNCKYRKE